MYRLICFLFLAMSLLPLSSALALDEEIIAASVQVDEPLKNTNNNEVKKLIKEILEDIENSIEGKSKSRYKAVRLIEGTVNNFNLKRARINLNRSFGYYSREYRGLFLDLMTSKLITHGIETGAAGVATVIQLMAPELTGWQRLGLGFVQSLAIPGAVDFLCWAGDACFISFYSYRKAMRKIRLNLVKVPKKMGITKLWNYLYTKEDGELIIDKIIRSDKRLNKFIIKKRSNTGLVYRLVDKKTKKVFSEFAFNRLDNSLSLKNMRFYQENLSSFPEKDFLDFLSLFNRNLKDAGVEARKDLLKGKIEKLNKEFHIEQVVDLNRKDGLKTVRVYDIELRDNTVNFSYKWKKTKPFQNFCSWLLSPVR